VDVYSCVVGIWGLLHMSDRNATTEPSEVKEVNHAIYAVYMIHLGKLQLFRGRPESGVIYIPEH